VSFVAGLLFGDLAQPDAFSPAKDNISDIGAQTADQAWIYNQIAANLNGLLILGFALGLWRALGSGWLARLGVLGLAVLGVTRFLEGFLRLDCRGMDEGCENTSWQADAHGIEPASQRRSSSSSRRCSRSPSDGSRSGATCGLRRSSLCPSWWPSAFSSAA
jgi:hypothetical protein